MIHSLSIRLESSLTTTIHTKIDRFRGSTLMQNDDMMVFTSVHFCAWSLNESTCVIFRW